MRDNRKARAAFVYAAARLHAITLGCPVIPHLWYERERDFREQFVKLVNDLCTGRRRFANPAEAHNSWTRKYRDMGWKYGPEYDPENRIHPDLVPYDKLDPKEKVKDEVFLRLVQIARDCMWDDRPVPSIPTEWVDEQIKKLDEEIAADKGGTP